MEEFMKGDIVVLPFPFSDLTNSKKRPALVVANTKGDDIILSQITSVTRQDTYTIELKQENFKNGSLNQKSLVRTNKLFTADQSLILYKIGILNYSKIKEIENRLVNIFTN
ncbi:growth inhibitor PemK [archaeon]|mgnify:CR=1 FL=1|nr:growth inhibitor PemK [archaeon]|tara:strand:+ start:2681 stop:3013 length:333 start_codon:yes stop_codon:yes gene_type:complete